MLDLHFPIVGADPAVEVFPELAKCAVINSDRAVGKMPLTYLVTSEILKTHRTNCESHQHISPTQNKKKKVCLQLMEAVNEHKYLRPN